MKAVIQDVKFIKSFDSKYGTLYSFKVTYEGREAYYNSKSKDQTKFIAGQEVEFTEEVKEGKKGDYLFVKPINPNKQSNYGKALKKEQTRYSGFAVSYAKDLVVAGRLPFEELTAYSTVLFEHMVELDKSIES